MLQNEIYKAVDMKMLYFLLNGLYKQNEDGSMDRKDGLSPTTAQDIINLQNAIIEMNKRIDLLFMLAGGEQTPAMQNKMDLGRLDTAYML